MSEWKGLHNPERHKSTPFIHKAMCDECGGCFPALPCRCCLAAEVDKWKARAELPLRERDGLRAEVERLTVANRALAFAVRLSSRDSLTQRERIEKALAMLDAALKYERNLGTHLSLTKISSVLRGDA